MVVGSGLSTVASLKFTFFFSFIQSHAFNLTSILLSEMFPGFKSKIKIMMK